MQLNLSENALKVLERRYLKKDSKGRVIETPEELFRRVAKAIAKVEGSYGHSTEEIEALEEEFLNMMASLEFIPNSPCLMNAGKELGQLSACFSPDQIIISENGPRPISEIKIGDYVLTHQNRFRKVVEIFKRKTKAIYSISAYKLPTPTLKVTAEHPLLAIKREGKATADWIQVKDLSVGDYIALTFPNETVDVESIVVSNFIKDENIIEKNGYLYERNEDIRYYIRKDGSIYTQDRNRSGDISKQVKPIKNRIKLDRDLMRLFGYYLSEGCISEDRCLRFVFSLKERNYAEDVLSLISNKFGISTRIEETISADRRWISIRFHSKILANFFKTLFGTGYNIKEIPDWIILLPIEKQKGLVSGMFRGDSCTIKNGNNFSTQLVMCNKQLIYSAWQILMRMDYFPSLSFHSMPKLGRVQPVQCQVSGKKGTKLINEFLEGNFTHNDIEFKREIICEGRIFTPMTKIIKEDYNDIVYNLEVEEDHSYCANMIAVHNCFTLPVNDSMESIFESLKATAMIHKSGGGTGFSFSNLRPKNSVVRSTGGIASGPVSFMKVYDAATEAVKQGGTRRGANMGILRVDHPDILEFIPCKDSSKKINNFNISVAITEDFMKKLQNNEKYDLIDPHTKKITNHLNAREVFNLIVKQAHKNGEPGIIFIDKINQANPTPKLGNIESTNPCLSGNSMIFTENGIFLMRDLPRHNPGIKLLTDLRSINSKGYIFANGYSLLTGKKKTHRLLLKNGIFVDATEDHKILTENGFVKVKDLKLKDKVSICIEDISTKWHGNMDKSVAQILGWLIGDGWIYCDSRYSQRYMHYGFVFDKDNSLALEVVKRVLSNSNVPFKQRYNKGCEEIVCYGNRASSFFDQFNISYQKEKSVPSVIFTGGRDGIIGFLQGLFSADGHVANPIKNRRRIVLTSVSLKLLHQIQILLASLGIYSSIRKGSSSKGVPYGKNKISNARQRYDLYITAASFHRFIDLINFPLSSKKQKKAEDVERLTKNLKFSKSISKWSQITKIIPLGVEDVYDIKEPLTHSFVANGISVHNCGEQPILPYESCDLGSVNLVRMVKKAGAGYEIDWQRLGKVIHLAVQFLDNVIDANKFPLSEIEKATKLTRKIGLGIMGWASLLTKLGIPYNSEEAVGLADRLMSFILEEAKKKSCQLTKEKGVFPAFKDSIWQKQNLPLRNATLTTIAPTGTISIIAGPTSSGIEPLFAISYYRNVMDNDKLVEVDSIFEELARERGFYSRQLMEKAAEGGSIQKIDEIPSDIRRIFVTAHDISPEWHIRMQAVFQKYTNNAVSKTINFPQDATVEDVEKAYLLAYKLGCKGITVYRDKSRQEQVLNIAGKKELEAREEPMVQAGKIVPQSRPEVTTGTTTKVATGCGNLYITINSDEQGKPFEVFTQMGKAGGCAASQLEAIGRLVSLALRSDIDVKSIIEQLRNIRCPSPSWEKGVRIFSCADALARIIEKRLVNTQIPTAASSTKSLKHGVNNIVGVCPDCGGALRHEEGCVKCYACGFTKC